MNYYTRSSKILQNSIKLNRCRQQQDKSRYVAVWLASGGVENCPTKTAVDAEIAESNGPSQEPVAHEQFSTADEAAESSGPSPDVAAEAVDVVQDSIVYPPASELTEPVAHQQFSTADEAAESSGPSPDVAAEAVDVVQDSTKKHCSVQIVFFGWRS